MKPQKNFEIIINFLFGIVEILLALRFLFKILGANIENNFVQWIYSRSEMFLIPLITSPLSVTLDERFIIELKTLLTIIGYACLNIVVIFLVRFIAYLANKLFRIK